MTSDIVKKLTDANLLTESEGAKIVAEMISGQSKLIDKLVFKAPKTAIEQMRNLQLATGNMNQTPAQGIKTTTDAIDSMLEALEQLGR